MPRRPKVAIKKKRAPRRRFRKSIPRGIKLPFPPHNFCIHKFSNVYNTVQVTAGTPQVQTFRLNQLFDLNYTSSTGGDPNNQQPLYYDEMTNIYKRFIVYRVDYKITGACTTNAYIGIRASSVLATPTNFILELERQGREGVVKFFTQGQKVIIKKTFYIADVFGDTRKNVLIDDEYQGSNSSTPPLRTGYAHVYFLNANPAGLTSCDYQVQMTLHVKWLDRKEASES